MPRITRAALRSNAAAFEASGDEASVFLPATRSKDRAPLSEIAGNALSEPFAPEVLAEEPTKSKAPAKERKRKCALQTKKMEIANELAEVLEDGNQSPVSSAAQEARDVLLDRTTEGDWPFTS